MSHRSVGQLSLAKVGEAARGTERGAGTVGAMVKWEPLERVYSASAGRQSYSPRVMFKCSLLQQRHPLSDPQLEKAVADRLSFRRFTVLAPDQGVPDYSTINRFRAQLAQLKLGGRQSAELNRQLAGHGLLVKHGTMLDATLIEASVKPVRGATSTLSGLAQEPVALSRICSAMNLRRAHVLAGRRLSVRAPGPQAGASAPSRVAQRSPKGKFETS